MKSRTTNRFRDALAALPNPIREQAREAFHLFQANPNHPSLHFKRIHTKRSIYSARISLGYRTLGVRKDDEIVWFWIGSHTEYDKLLAQA